MRKKDKVCAASLVKGLGTGPHAILNDKRKVIGKKLGICLLVGAKSELFSIFLTGILSWLFCRRAYGACTLK